MPGGPSRCGLLAARGCGRADGARRRMRWAVVGLSVVYGVLLGWDGRRTRRHLPGVRSGAWVKTRAGARGAGAAVLVCQSAVSRMAGTGGRPVRPLDCSLSSTSAATDEGTPVVQSLASPWSGRRRADRGGVDDLGSLGGVPRLTPRHLLKSRAAYATLALGLGAGAWGVNEARLSAQFFGNPEIRFAISTVV